MGIRQVETKWLDSEEIFVANDYDELLCKGEYNFIGFIQDIIGHRYAILIQSDNVNHGSAIRYDFEEIIPRSVQQDVSGTYYLFDENNEFLKWLSESE